MVIILQLAAWPPTISQIGKSISHLFFFLIIFLFSFIYLWLCWVFVSVRGLSLVAASGDHSSSRCVGLSLSRPLLLRSTGSRCAGSVIVAHGPSCSAACGIFPDQDLNPCPLHWQADSQPLRHQGSPNLTSLKIKLKWFCMTCSYWQKWKLSLTGHNILSMNILICSYSKL